jgi:hypothetical protein
MPGKSKTLKPAKRPPRITTEAFDAKFDAGEDISEYLDLGSARLFNPGEARPFDRTKTAADRKLKSGDEPLE